MRNSFLILIWLAAVGHSAAPAADYDVVIYGATPAGVGAALQTTRMGKSVVLIEPGQHIGGLTSGGLGWTDTGNKSVIGGIAHEFYGRIKKHYDDPSAWKYEKAAHHKFYRPAEDTMWTFEPGVAEQTLRAMLGEQKVPIVLGERLERTPGKGVSRDAERITTLVMESGKTFGGKMFIDATYEGDLMAAAGVHFAVGREPNTKYGETLNGMQRAQNKHLHRFVVPVDPYVGPGDPKSGLLPGIDPGPYPADGEGDQRIQAYCFRMCMSDVPENRVPFPKPDRYDEAQYELLLRNFEAGDLRLPLKIDRMPNGKTDTNNNCAVSTDYIGQNYKYPEASYAEREKILREHETYQKGLMWTLANHPRVPQKIRDEMSSWGLPKDEFTDNGNWPHQLYVREARRMVSDYVMTELDCRRQRVTPQSIGMGSYNMDSHNCMRYVTSDGHVQNEGDVETSPGGPYMISYLSIVPKQGECPNLLVPVCVSSSHIAYGSIRMEPVFLILGQSAATAAVLALEGGVDVQKLDYAKLRERLLADKQVLAWTKTGAARQSSAATRPGTPKVVCLGDSITHRGYPAVLEKLLGVQVINAGVGGNTSQGGLARLEKDVLNHHPDAVVILFGTNDGRLDAPGVHVPVAKYESNLAEMIERCRRAGEGRAVYAAAHQPGAVFQAPREGAVRRGRGFGQSRGGIPSGGAAGGRSEAGAGGGPE